MEIETNYPSKDQRIGKNEPEPNYQPQEQMVAQFGVNVRGGSSSNNRVDNFGNVTRYLQMIFGDGSDGDVVISSNTNLTADKYYNNLTINGGVTLSTKGYRVFVRNKLTNNGTISSSGGNGGNGGNGADNVAGTAGTAGVVAGSGYYATQLAGEPGGAGDVAGDNGVNTTKSYLSDNAKAGGNGGNGGGGGTAGSSGGTAGTTTQATYIPKVSVENQLGICLDDLGSLAKFSLSGSPGGGGGGGAGYLNGGHKGGGGGGGGSGAPGGAG